MSGRADLRWPAEQDPRHSFADISVDGDEFGGRQHGDELRGQDTSPLFPMVNANVVPEGFRPRIGDEVSWQPGKFLRKIVCHSQFPALVVGAYARGNCGNNLKQVASGIASHPTNYGDPVLEQFATGAGA